MAIEMSNMDFSNEKPSQKPAEDLQIVEAGQVLDEVTLKRTEVLDAYGNEEGAEIQCKPSSTLCFTAAPY